MKSQEKTNVATDTRLPSNKVSLDFKINYNYKIHQE